MTSVNEAACRVNNGENIYLIDVRRAGEYKDYHITGSINVPFDEIASVERMIPDRGAEIYLFCGSGQHSRSAKTVLEYLNYTNVHNLGAL